MIKIFDKSKCSGCHACATACPKKCISMEKDVEGFLYPKVAENECINCGLCDKACPVIERNSVSKETFAYAAISKNEEIRLQSSSGGVFTAIAEEVIDNGGVVFGAAYDESFDVKHICVESTEELSKLRGSKYVQSRIGDTYKRAKSILDSGRIVYFTGTPCQIEGLLKYLGKEYNNLLTSDIICHGVPSPMVWQEYLKFKSDKKPINVFHRNKEMGWATFSMAIDYSNETAYRCIAKEDPYLKAFSSNICLRPSCYSCAFKSKNRASDLTLADFWGADKIMPELNDNKGISLLLVHTGKGAEMLKKISNKISLQTADIDNALNYNPACQKSVEKSENRNKFMKTVNSNNFDKIVDKYSKRTFVQKVKRKLRSIFK